jgi:hypothetical protein
MIWSPGAAHFTTLNVKRNLQCAPHPRAKENEIVAMEMQSKSTVLVAFY